MGETLNTDTDLEAAAALETLTAWRKAIRAHVFHEAMTVVLDPIADCLDEMPKDPDKATEWALRRALAVTFKLKAEEELRGKNKD
jgi:hypothetical protein